MTLKNTLSNKDLELSVQETTRISPVTLHNPSPGEDERLSSVGHWTFLSNHTHVLLCLVRDPSQTIRQIAQNVGITERSVQKIIVDLEQAGVLHRERVGRNNRYNIDLSKPLRHPLESHCTLSELLKALGVPGFE